MRDRKRVKIVRAELKKVNTYRKEVNIMENTLNQRIKLSDLRKMATDAIKKRGLSEEQVRKTLGDKRYE